MKTSSTSDKAITGNVVDVQTGQSVGNCGPGTSSVGHVVDAADSRLNGAVAGGGYGKGK